MTAAAIVSASPPPAQPGPPPGLPPPPFPPLRGCVVRGHSWRANSGGPHSRTRVEHIVTTVLGNQAGPVRCPPVMRVAIDFGAEPPLDRVRRWLTDAGFEGEEEARRMVALPKGPCICRADIIPSPAAADGLTAREGLALALVLGLCTPHLYDPRRPVLWTRTSLTRRLILYSPEGFYA